ncbi:MAG: hypothetical protein ACMVY4_06205 [Minwuia sp.]|uniref:hypothetical protein n=1 Tax=Minwuia sp. TaxID=2493630 RepID=UPI003A851430
MRRPLAIALFAALLAACGTLEPEELPPAAFDKPVLHADGTLTGVQGVDHRHWALVDQDLRKGVFWYSFLNRVTQDCKQAYPEHADWLGEVNLLVQRATGQAARAGIRMERQRLETRAEGADRAVVGLEAMSVAEVEVAGVLAGWIESATGEEVPLERALVQGCALLFDRENLRGLMRNSAEPLSRYFARMEVEQPDIYAATGGVEGIVRRLDKV